jgi:hypothetical protein
MRTNLPRLGRVFAAAAATVTIAACGGSSVLTTWSDESAELKSATRDAAAAEPASATIRGSVVDSSNRALANVNIECLGDVRCAEPGAQVVAEGHEHQVGQTDANGRFEIVASSLPGTSSTGFMMNANRRGYEVTWKQVAWPGPACSSDQARCTITVDFKVNPTQDPAQ